MRKEGVMLIVNPMFLENKAGLYKFSLLKSDGEEYQVPFNIEAVGRKNFKWGRGYGCRNFWEKNQDFKKWGWGRISSRRDFYTPL